ncbi:MAG: DotU family type IV/VI secretion system protein [Bryobacteraceae bacterium]
MLDSSPLLASQFREFQAALAALVARACAPDAPPPAQLRREAIELVEQQRGCLRNGAERITPERESEFIYAAAASADETFVGLDWDGRGYWRDHLVETGLFGSRAAGERIFARIDELADGDDVGRLDMAAVYLLMVGLGFRGRFRDEAGAVEVERRRARLWTWIERKRPALLGDGRAVTPQAYAHTIQEGTLVQLATPARWWRVTALMVGLWVVGSVLAWDRLIADIVNRIEAVERRIDAGVSQPGARPFEGGRKGAEVQ